MSKVPAHWDEIAKVVALRDQLKVNTVIIGNGDIENRAHGLELAMQSGVDGLMIGRGIFHDPFVFSKDSKVPGPEERLKILLRHLELYEQWGTSKSFQTLKKFFKIYVSSWPGASELRVELMESTTPKQVRDIINHYSLPQALNNLTPKL
jgi:tRNA-dihydrouridine synthase